MLRDGDRPDRRTLIRLSQAGYAALRDKRPADAAKQFERLLLLDPSNSYGMVGLAQVARSGGDAKGARQWYERCLEQEPDNPFALKGAAECCADLQDDRSAVELWTRYIAGGAGEDAVALTRIGDAWRRLGERKRSEEAYRRALAVEPHNRYAMTGLGHLEYEAGRWQQSAEHWQQLLALEPQSVYALTSLGNCLRRTGDFAAALERYQEALRLEPDNFYALFGAADSLRGLGDYVRSREAWEALLERDPSNRIILTRVGDAYRHLGDLDAARRHYERALAVDFDVYAVIGLARVAGARADYGRAVAILTDLRGREPRNARVAVELADCLLLSGDREGAAKVLRRFLEEAGPDPLVSSRLRELGS